MIKNYIDKNTVKIDADIGMDLIRVTDNYRAKEIYCPLSEESNWIEGNEIPLEELKE